MKKKELERRIEALEKVAERAGTALTMETIDCPECKHTTLAQTDGCIGIHPQGYGIATFVISPKRLTCFGCGKTWEYGPKTLREVKDNV